MDIETQLQAKCRYIIFRNEANQYTVARFQRTDEKGEQFTATGHIPHLETNICETQ